MVKQMRLYQKIYNSYNTPIYMLLLHKEDQYLIGFDTMSWLPVDIDMINDGLKINMFSPILPETFSQLIHESTELIISCTP